MKQFGERDAQAENAKFLLTKYENSKARVDNQGRGARFEIMESLAT